MNDATSSDPHRIARAATQVPPKPGPAARPRADASSAAASGPARTIVAVGLGLWMAAAFQAFTPDLPHAGLDASWVAVMGEAADRGLRWGSDLAFTYGPASTLVTHYGNDAYLPLTLPLLVATCLLFAACALRLAGGGVGRTAAAAVALGVVAANAAATPDAFFLALPLLPVLVVLSPMRPGRGASLLAAATALAVGAIGLAKMSYPAAALPLFVLADVVGIARRRAPLLTLPFAVGFLLSDLAYGQGLADLPSFLRQQSEVVAGYSEAMALDGSRRELLAFVLAAGALWLGTALAGERGPARHGRWAVPACLGWTLFMTFKAGFVRQDLHTVIAWNGLAFAATIIALAQWDVWRRGPARTVLVAAVVGAVAVNAGVAALTAGVPAGRAGATLGFERDRLVADPWVQASAAAALLRDPAGAAAGLREDRAEAWRAAAAAEPLPPLAGGVDIIPSRQNAVMAAGLDYRPRPSFQEYSTYTEGLSEANRAFIEGPRAPAWILFGPEAGARSLTLDNRYPNLAEGALWPDLLSLYRPDGRIGDLVALHRRPSPAGLDWGEPQRGTAALGQEIPVADGSAVFATVDVRPTLLGRLAGLLFRPAPLTLTVAFADGGHRTYQFISGIGRSGFVLSPLVGDAADFEALTQGAPPPADRRVVGFSVAPPPRLAPLVSPEVTVVQRSLAVPPPRGAAP